MVIIDIQGHVTTNFIVHKVQSDMCSTHKLALINHTHGNPQKTHNDNTIYMEDVTYNSCNTCIENTQPWE